MFNLYLTIKQIIKMFFLYIIQMKRVKSAGTARQMHQSPSWLAFLWSHKESDAESRPAEWLTGNEWWKRTAVHDNWLQKKRMHCFEENEQIHWLVLNPFHELHWDLDCWKAWTVSHWHVLCHKNGDSPLTLGILCSKFHECELDISLF